MTKITEPKFTNVPNQTVTEPPEWARSLNAIKPENLNTTQYFDMLDSNNDDKITGAEIKAYGDQQKKYFTEKNDSVKSELDVLREKSGKLLSARETANVAYENARKKDRPTASHNKSYIQAQLSATTYKIEELEKQKRNNENLIYQSTFHDYFVYKMDTVDKKAINLQEFSSNIK